MPSSRNIVGSTSKLKLGFILISKDSNNLAYILVQQGYEHIKVLVLDMKYIKTLNRYKKIKLILLKGFEIRNKPNGKILPSVKVYLRFL